MDFWGFFLKNYVLNSNKSGLEVTESEIDPSLRKTFLFWYNLGG